MKNRSKKISVSAVLVGENYTLSALDFEFLAATLKLSPLPDFRADDVHCIEELNKHCAYVMTAPRFVSDDASELAGWVVIFDFKDELHITVPFETEGLAAAAALLFVIRSKRVKP